MHGDLRENKGMIVGADLNSAVTKVHLENVLN